jgi:hypothetical protein
MWRQRSAETSPRRGPVSMVSQKQQAPLLVNPGSIEQGGGLVGARWVRFGVARRRRLGHGGLVDAELAPSHGPVESPADDVVDLPGGAAAQRSARVPGSGSPGAQRATAVQAGVEALEELGVEPARQMVAEGREDVEPDEVLIPLARGGLELDDVEPLLDGLAHRDVGLRV